jgi:hypothetical protein
MSTTKKAKATEARKNAEAQKAQKKVMRASKASADFVSGPARKGQKKGPSLIKASKKKK